MKQLFLLVALFFALPLNAQQLEVESPAELIATSIYASRNPRKTPKGKFCGVLMVHSTIPNLRFEGNVVGDVAYQDGIYYVYVAPESSKLKVTNPAGNFLNLVLPKVQSKATYQVTVYEVESRGSLVCNSDPAGAHIVLITSGGEIDLGKTPIKGNVDILEGTYSIRASKIGFKEKIVKNVKIRGGKTTRLGTIKLSRL